MPVEGVHSVSEIHCHPFLIYVFGSSDLRPQRENYLQKTDNSVPAIWVCASGRCTFPIQQHAARDFPVQHTVHGRGNSVAIQGKILLAAGVFSALLNFKHIYLYVAPVYFIYILKFYVMKHHQIQRQIAGFLKVAAIALVPFVLSFGPFLVAGGFDQLKFILGRLFPFGRGLVHSYWAPNIWAYYGALDRLLAALLQKPGYLIEGFR